MEAAKASRDGAGGGGETISDVEFAATIKKLAGMPLAQYERARMDEAKRLGVRVSVLDKLVANERPRDESSPGQGSPLDFPSPEPWPDPVDGAELLNELRDTVREYVVCSDHKIIAVVLWIVATWFEPAAQVAPILNIRSPINRCGKTTLLDIVGKLSKRALMAAGITPAALFRTIEICLPTLIIDEADSFFGANDELRGVVDSVPGCLPWLNISSCPPRTLSLRRRDRAKKRLNANSTRKRDRMPPPNPRKCRTFPRERIHSRKNRYAWLNAARSSTDRLRLRSQPRPGSALGPSGEVPRLLCRRDASWISLQ